MKKVLIPLFSVAALVAFQNASADEIPADVKALLNGKACLACHSVENKLVGPSYKEVAAKHDGEEGAVATVADHIKNGSTGVYGPIPMPPNAVTEEEATLLAEWVLSQK
ncbi:MAG: cytochrome C biogenesis protein CcsA [Thiopseudomonas sp.]|nr:c-type cytochrome [Gammaproteobacteria bacterium]